MQKIVHYTFPESARKAFTAYVENLGIRANPYQENNPANPYAQFPGLPYAFAQRLVDVLKSVPSSAGKEYENAQGILNEWDAQREGRGSLAYTIDNMPCDRLLPNTPQEQAEAPVNRKGTFVSEAAMLGAAVAEGQQPYSQPGMQGGALITQVIPKPHTDPHEQTNEGRTVLALHTEISSAPDEKTPSRQYLLGLRGGEAQAPVGQRLFTTVVPLELVLSKMDPEEIDLLRQDLFHFRSGAAIKNPGDVIERDGPILTQNSKGQIEMRFHADNNPARPRVTVRTSRIPGDAAEAKLLGKAHQVLQKLNDACNVMQHPELNASVVEVGPSRFLSWDNKKLLHGRAHTGMLLENALIELKHGHMKRPSLQTVYAMFGEYCDIPKLIEEYERTKPDDGKLTEPDPNARWVQRLRGIPPADKDTAESISAIKW